jgi:isopentenyl-diphosphate delta-isomerase
MSGVIEYFDVVDKQDRPTGARTTKKEAHETGLLHRLVAVYVFAKDGKLYVQDHKASGMLDHSVGGHVSTGEDYLTAAKREAEEELSLKDEELISVYASLYSDELYDAKVQNDIQMHQFGIYECYPSETWEFKPNDEVERIIPMDIEKIVAQMTAAPGKFTPGFLNTMAKYLEIKGLPYTLDMTRVRAIWGKTR